MLSLFGFAAGFMACRWQTRNAVTGLVTTAAQIQEAYAVEASRTAAEEIYFTESSDVALGAMLCYVAQLNARRELPSTLSTGYYPMHLYIAHGRLAKLYHKLEQENAAKRHTEMALSFHTMPEDFMIWKIDEFDRCEREEREEKANQ